MLADKLTKIMCTISDANCDVTLLKSLYENGMNIVRLNTAHQTLDSTLHTIKNIRQVSDDIAILLDTKGPEVRTTQITKDIPVSTGQIVKISGQPEDNQTIAVNYKEFAKYVPEGCKILMDDGILEFTVIQKDQNHLVCKAENDGVLKDKKTVNVPGVHLNVPSLAPMDPDYIKFAIDNNLDFIAHSFVRNKEDILAVQEILDQHDSPIKIIAKIESKESIANLQDIIEHSFGVIVARGDLGVEIPVEHVPLVQKEIIQTCRKLNKPVIIATHMLESMINHPRATRAEISDIANAILDGADALTLSGETAYGKYPVQAVQQMARIARHITSQKESNGNIAAGTKTVTDFILKKAIDASIELPVKIIFDISDEISFSQKLSALRGHVPLFKLCKTAQQARLLAGHYGILPLICTGENQQHSIKKILTERLEANLLKKDNLFLVIEYDEKEQIPFFRIRSVGNGY